MSAFKLVLETIKMSQMQNPHPQNPILHGWEVGNLQQGEEGSPWLWIKCWSQQETQEHFKCAGGIPARPFFMLRFISSSFLFNPGRKHLQGPQNPDLCGFAPVCNSGLQFCIKGLHIHPLKGFGSQTLGVFPKKKSSFSPFSHTFQLSPTTAFFPPLLQHSKFVNLSHFPVQMFPADPERNKRVVNTSLNVYKTARADEYLMVPRGFCLLTSAIKLFQRRAQFPGTEA